MLKVHQAGYTQKMGRLSEDIMALFGLQPSDQTSGSVEQYAISTAPHDGWYVYACIIY